MTGQVARKSLLAAGLAGACTALTLAPVATAEAPVRIHDIQGATRVSEMAGEQVDGVSGVVTGVRSFGEAQGFWFQDPEPDDDPRTSEGLFVYTAKETPDVSVGDKVTVSGEVAEYYPESQDSPYQSTTQLTKASWKTDGQADVPAPEVLKPDTVPAKYTQEGELDKLDLAPEKFALDFYESREGMNLRINDARVVGPTDDYGAAWVTSKPEENPTERGGTAYTGYDQQNSGRLKIESLIPKEDQPFPAANVGDRFEGSTTGPLDYSNFGGYVLQAAELGKHVPGDLKPETTREQGKGELAVGTYNVENLDAADEQAKFDRLAEGIANNLASPDIVALEEVQDNNGATDDGTVAADETLKRFTDAIAAAGGPKYEFRQINPENNADGGEPGGNIRVGFLFNPERVSFVDREGGDATTPVKAVDENGNAALSISPGRVDPTNEAWSESRKPLAGEFEFNGQKVFVIANHFTSKGDDEPLHGRFQPPNRVTEEQRIAEAKSVRGFVDELRGVDENAKVVVAGDLNDFGFSPAVGELTKNDGLINPADSLPEQERYSYVFDGNSQSLDHMLVSPGVGEVDYDIVHINAEFADQASDHDPQVARIKG